MKMIFKKSCCAILLFFSMSPQLAFSAATNITKEEIVKSYGGLLPVCVKITDIQMPADFIEFVNGCRGHIEVGVKERKYNISSPDVVASCDDFNGDKLRTNVIVDGNARVVVASQKLKSMTILDGSMIGFNNIELSDLKGGVLCEKPSDYSYTLKRNVNSSDVIYESYIKQSYAIRRSQLVDVAVRSSGGIEIQTQAKATGNAYVNDIVNVVSLSSHRLFKVRVVDYGKCVVI